MGRLKLALACSLVASLFAATSASADHETYGTATMGSGSGLGLSADVSDGLGILAPPSPTALGGEAQLAAPGAGAGLGAADDTSGDFHCANFRKLGRTPIDARRRHARAGHRDLAFQGNLMIAGAYEGVGLFRISDGGASTSSRSTTAPARRATSRSSARRCSSPSTAPARTRAAARPATTPHSTAAPSSVGKEGVRDRRHLRPAHPAPGRLRRDRVRVAHPHPDPGRQRLLHLRRLLPARPGGRLHRGSTIPRASSR